ncbi:translation initiation factor eIF3 subunit [Rickenella mellea]|uniref:Eukaryotic translation initiation factor 3 subunit J n=1 Tax=Rickenella mellea TaxID=50990 RepID=A0A4Y7QFB1_9AGAM|nr:translation initiation factor eIF3 subunit [Rickenella mellea]
MSDWENSDNESPAPAANPPPKAPVLPKVPAKSKWEGEDEEENVASDWEESSDEEDKKPAATSTAAPPKKKGTLKAKLAEKEALKAARRDTGDDDSLYDSDDVLDPREKARRDKEREINADISNAAELLGAAALGGTSDKELDKLVSENPRTKEEFQAFSSRIVEYIIKRHQNKPLYASFIEHHVRELALPLKDVEVRKVASSLTTLANEKQKEAKDKASGKKKPKAANKPGLGAVKAVSKMDTNLYDEALDDFGNDDFM